MASIFSRKYQTTIVPTVYAIAVFILLVPLSSSSFNWGSECYKSIISFGDSLEDTGNLPLLRSPNNPPASALPPFGETFFHHPNGRFSDGRLVIDFIADSLELPFVQPYLIGRNANFSGRVFEKGVNFAVAGATALDMDFFNKRGINNPMTNVTLGDELVWFKQFLATLSDERKYLQDSLVLVGEIGGNDYKHPLTQGKPIEEVVQTFVPSVINNIGSTIQELIKFGVRTMLVPGSPPNGCLPFYLTYFWTISTENDYDPKTGCLNWLNNLSMYHNQLLQKEVSRIQELHRDVTIIYADYYNAVMRLYISPDEFGFTKDILRACCGAGEPYNFNSWATCGTPPTTCCHDPSMFASWDGIHFTEATYKWIAQGLLEGPYTIPQIKTTCPFKSRPTGLYEY